MRAAQCALLDIIGKEIIKTANEAGPKLDKLITAAISKF